MGTKVMTFTNLEAGPLLLLLLLLLRGCCGAKVFTVPSSVKFTFSPEANKRNRSSETQQLLACLCGQRRAGRQASSQSQSQLVQYHVYVLFAEDVPLSIGGF